MKAKAYLELNLVEADGQQNVLQVQEQEKKKKKNTRENIGTVLNGAETPVAWNKTKHSMSSSP